MSTLFKALSLTLVLSVSASSFAVSVVETAQSTACDIATAATEAVTNAATPVLNAAAEIAEKALSQKRDLGNEFVTGTTKAAQSIVNGCLATQKLVLNALTKLAAAGEKANELYAQAAKTEFVQKNKTALNVACVVAVVAGVLYSANAINNMIKTAERKRLMEKGIIEYNPYTDRLEYNNVEGTPYTA